jgi:type II secretory pathway pseudopilin PulG
VYKNTNYPPLSLSQKKRLSLQAGLTLIELLTTAAVISLLILVLFFAWRAQLNKANDAKRKADLERLRVAFEDYYTDNQCYPPVGTIDICRGSALVPYLNLIPCDPVYDLPYCYISDGSDCSQSFKLLSSLKFTSDSVIETLLCDSEVYCGYETECAQPGVEYEGFNYGLTSGNVPLINTDVVPSPIPSPSADPSSSPGGQYACTAGEMEGDPGVCNSYADPVGAGCPVSYEESDCNNECDNPDNWCLE